MLMYKIYVDNDMDELFITDKMEKEELEFALPILVEKFPKKEGYNVMVLECDTKFRFVNNTTII